MQVLAIININTLQEFAEDKPNPPQPKEDDCNGTGDFQINFFRT